MLCFFNFYSRLSEAILVPKRRSAMEEETKALTKNRTWDLVDLSKGNGLLGVSECILLITKLMVLLSIIRLDWLLMDSLRNT